MRVVGRPTRQVRWDPMTSGSERYSGDVRLEGMLLGGVLRSPLSYGQVRSIDTREAESVPGVHAVVTAADLPSTCLYIHEGGSFSDRPPLARDFVRFIGQEVAGVAAETEYSLRRALQAIKVRYRSLDAPTSLAEARFARQGLHRRGSRGPTVATHLERHWGEPALARSLETVSVSGQYVYPRIAHTCLEPNTTVARWDRERERLELWTSTQSPYFVVKEVAHALELEEEQVVCREVAIGGGFGSKSTISDQEVIAAALARKACRPVRLALTREEEFATTKTRHRFEVDLRLSADNEGRLCLMEAKVDVENGGYNHSGPSVLSAGIRTLGELYEPVGVTVDGNLIDTATQPGGQFRGYGHAQVTFALESLVDELAATMGTDPISLRLRNANRPETTTVGGSRIHTARLAECIGRAAEEIGWSAKRGRLPRGRGVGLAVAIGGSGSYAYEGANRSTATVEVGEDGGITVRFGGADPGTGQRTILAQVAAEAFGVEPAAVSVEMMDSESTPCDMGAWSSRGTQMGGHAVTRAAAELASHLRKLGKEKLGDDVELNGGAAIAPSGDRVALGDLVRLSEDVVDSRLGVTSEYVVPDVEMPGAREGQANVTPSHAFAAHAAEVNVDERTGEVKIIDYVAVHDSGSILNPLLAEGQVVGAVVMGLGAALGEEVIHEHGRMVNPAFINYAVPRAADSPVVRPIFVNSSEPAGPYGAKGLGEIPIMPAPPAVANAIYDAIGVRIRELPITPDKVLAALALQGGRKVKPVPIWQRPSRWYIAAMRAAYPLGIMQLLDRVGTRFSHVGPDEVTIVAEALDLATIARDHPTAELIAGGTDVLPRAKKGLAKDRTLVKLQRTPHLCSIRRGDDDEIYIGAMTTLSEAARGLADDIPVIARTIDTIASPQIRNMATVGGNLVQEKRCWFYRHEFNCYKRGGPTCPCYAVTGDHRFYHAAMNAHRCQAVTPSDLATTLVALDASVTIRACDGDPYLRPMEDFYTGPGETCLRRGDIIMGLSLPPVARRRNGIFEKMRLWQGDFAVLSVAVTAMRGGPRDTRVVFGALGPTPWRARLTEDAFDQGDDPIAALAAELGHAAHPLRRNGWKLEAALGLAERAFEELLAFN